MRETKIEAIKHRLVHGYSITSMEAFDSYKVTRLSGIIHVLRKRGIPIKSILHPIMEGDSEISRYAEYTIEPSVLIGKYVDYSNRLSEFCQHLEEKGLTWDIEGNRFCMGIRNTTEKMYCYSIDEVEEIYKQLSKKIDQLWGAEEEKKYSTHS